MNEYRNKSAHQHINTSAHYMRYCLFIILVLLGVKSDGKDFAQTKSGRKVLEEINLSTVWSGHPTGFKIITTNKDQYAAFYDSSRNMCIAHRNIDNKKWEISRLPSIVGWDSHNYISLTQDRTGYIHVAGNMHNVSLVYFRSKRPNDIKDFERLSMTGVREDKVTYPVFFNDASGNLFFQYRDGESGNGVTLWNQYNENTKKWTRVFDQGIFDGEGEANAYSSDPRLGPDGYFHIVWMWRATSVANTCHNLSHMKSKDLVHWESVQGKPLTLPVKWRESKVFVDPAGPWNGLINSNFSLCWDNKKRMCITYHKYDPDGVSQLFVARWEVKAWKIYQISHWKDYRWNIDEVGSLGMKIGKLVLKPVGGNRLMGEYYNEKYGKGMWVIEETDFRILEDHPGQSDSDLPAELIEQKPQIEGMQINRSTDNTGNYMLQWETLPTFQDKPRNPPYPAPTWLKVIRLSDY
jgi:hypothetical protein